MHRFSVFIAALLVATSAISGGASDRSAAAASAEPDYAQAANWVCRPGAENDCTTGLDATIETPGAPKQSLAFAPAANPAIDCFYVYPTVSKEQTDDSDLQDSPEIRKVVNNQVGRLTSRCRVFAPIYRQITLSGLGRYLNGAGGAPSGAASRDVQAAWAYYLAHDNAGRGVVLIGHSQGTIELQKLIARFIDGKSAQKLLVAAFLAGDPTLGVTAGKSVGEFAHVPLCSAAADVGCAYAWGSYRDGDTAEHFFGAKRDDGMLSACDHPAAPGGGTGSLKYFHLSDPRATLGAQKWIESVGAFTGSCRSDAAGNAFIVRTDPGPSAAANEALLADAEFIRGWGLHRIDVGLAQGNILDVLDAEIATWTSRH